MYNFPVTNSKRLQDFLNKKGWMQTDLARLLKVSPVTVWRWTDGRSEPAPKLRKKLSQKLGFEWVKGGSKNGI